MSDGRVRLRVAGQPDDGAQLPIADEDARVALPEPTIALAGPGAGALAIALTEGARTLGATCRVWTAHVRAHGSVERARGASGETVVRAPAEEIAAAIDALVDGEGHESALRVAIGAPFVSLRRASLSILVTGGAAPLEWDPALRAMRDRFELVLAEPRPGVARELVRRLLAAG